ncbi:MAG: hypothetical protein R3251_00760 [Candidatus Spechtbacterales bacterium]|nr:hypothetical protein [Candidatus Spechtbacterales bacterium]
MENTENKKNTGIKGSLEGILDNYMFTLFLALLSSIGIAYFILQVGQFVFMRDLSALA